MHKYQNNEIPDLYQSYHSSHMRSQGNTFHQPNKVPNEQHYSLGSADSSLYNTVHTETTGYSKPEAMPHEIMTSPVTTPGAPKTETEALQAQRKFFVMDKKMGHGIGVVWISRKHTCLRIIRCDLKKKTDKVLWKGFNFVQSVYIDMYVMI